jgi:hypothetical protein
VPERRASRFALEVFFLVALAVALTLAKQRPLVIAGVMALGWVVAALFEWLSWRGEPHYGSGLPPRYYVPQISLPPRRPLEQFGDGYPGAQRDEAPTWIASPALRAEVLGDWPIAAAGVDEDTQAEPEPLADEPDEPEPEPELEPAALDEPQLWDRGEDRADPWLVAELPAGPERVVVAATFSVIDPGRTARHRIDPLAEPEPRRSRWRRHAETNGPVAEMPARPVGPRVLPGRSRRED